MITNRKSHKPFQMTCFIVLIYVYSMHRVNVDQHNKTCFNSICNKYVSVVVHMRRCCKHGLFLVTNFTEMHWTNPVFTGTLSCFNIKLLKHDKHKYIAKFRRKLGRCIYILLNLRGNWDLSFARTKVGR